MMYEELISKLREVFPEIDCNHCPVNRNCLELKGFCTFEKAADAIKELNSKVNELYCLICDVNAKEIATQIESGNLYNFLNIFRKYADKIVGMSTPEPSKEEI